jgi:hypothetical protein
MARMRFGVGLAAALALAGCASSVPATNPAGVVGSATSVAAPAPPADSPLSACVDPAPTRAKPIDTAVADDFAADRVQNTSTPRRRRIPGRAAPAGRQSGYQCGASR